MKKSILILGAVSASFLAALTPSLHAQILFYEGFNYAESSSLGGQGNWTASSGNMTIGASSVGFGDLVTTGRSAGASSGSNTLRIDTGLANPASGVRWVSFVFLQTNGMTNFQAQQLILGDTAGNQMILVGNNGIGSPNPQVMGTGGSYAFFNGGVSQTFPTGASSATTTATFFALKYDYDNTSISLFYNPTPGASEGSLTALGTLTAASNNLAPIHMNLGRIQITANNVYAGSIFFDEIRVGNTWADVAPIPEPSTLGLAVAALGAILLLRRKMAA
jgi:hypothetical protein